MGDAGGDPDWYGYCLDDPVNMIDPKGLKGFASLLQDLFSTGIEGIQVGNESINEAINSKVEKVIGPDGVEWNGKGRTVFDGPKHGNWGGKKHSGGSDGKQPPVNSADKKYQKHDLNYDKIRRTPILGDVNKTQKEMIKAADKELVKDLKQLPDNSDKWEMPPAKGDKNASEWFRRKAIWWFGE